jgi:PAS domain S-box-containing protein
MPKNLTDLYLRILDQFPNPIWRAGLDAKCDFFNKAWLEFTGRTMKQEMGDGWAKGVHPEDLKPCVENYLKHFKAREAFKLEYRLKHNDGTYHWILDYGNPFYDDRGKFLGYIGSCYDAEQERRHRAELEKLNSFMINREAKMMELKKIIKGLQKNK